MPKTITIPWDPADHLQTKEDMAAYLEAALDENDPTLVASALEDIARANGMTQIVREAGLACDSFTPVGSPEFAIILKVVQVLGLQLHATPAGTKTEA